MRTGLSGADWDAPLIGELYRLNARYELYDEKGHRLCGELRNTFNTLLIVARVSIQEVKCWKALWLDQRKFVYLPVHVQRTWWKYDKDECF